MPGSARGERGGEEEAGGGHSQSYTAGGGSDWSHPEGLTKGNGAGQVSSGWSRGCCRFTELLVWVTCVPGFTYKSLREETACDVFHIFLPAACA